MFLRWYISSLIESPRETERDWDKDLAEEVKGECEDKYGKVEAIKVDRDSPQVRRASFYEGYSLIQRRTLGGNIRQVRQRRFCEEGHSRLKRTLVWWTTGFRYLHIRCPDASFPVTLY